MEIAVKFITKTKYDFEDKNGQRVAGTTAYCFEPKTQKIIKVKVKHENVIANKEFGADMTVFAIPNGRYLNYEI